MAYVICERPLTLIEEVPTEVYSCCFLLLCAGQSDLPWENMCKYNNLELLRTSSNVLKTKQNRAQCGPQMNKQDDR